MQWVMHKAAQPDAFTTKCGEFVNLLHKAAHPVLEDFGLVSVGGGGETVRGAYIYLLRATAKEGLMRARLNLNIRTELRELGDSGAHAAVDFGVYIPAFITEGAIVAPHEYSAQKSVQLTASGDWANELPNMIASELRAFLEENPYVSVAMFVAKERTDIVRDALLQAARRIFIPELVKAAERENLVLQSVYPSLVCHTQWQSDWGVTHYYCTVYGSVSRNHERRATYYFHVITVVASTIALDATKKQAPRAVVLMNISSITTRVEERDEQNETARAVEKTLQELPQHKVTVSAAQVNEQTLKTLLHESARSIIQNATQELPEIIRTLTQSVR